MDMCSDCEAMQKNDARPHDALARGATRKGQTTGWRKIENTEYKCRTCGAQWERWTDEEDGVQWLLKS